MYEAILSSTLEILSSMPTPVPEKGGLAGIIHEYRPEGGKMFANDNYHFSMGTSYLKLGVSGVAEKAEKSAEKAEKPEERELLQGIAQVYREVARYFEKYAQAVKQAAGEDERLLRIAENLHAISFRAPQHFDEALQLLYQMWKIRVLRQCGADLGRLDVHLRPFFEADMASGYLTEEEALSLLCRLWEMITENDSGDTLSNVMVGGSNADGSDASSRLSVLMLKATQRCALSEPHINVRVHPGMSEELWQAMLEVQLMGQGQATMYNDEVIIPSLERFGIPHELACQFTNDGCSEFTLDGYSGIDFEHIDAVAAFELAFNNGDWAARTYREASKYWTHRNEKRFYVPDACPGFASGKPEECESFEELYQQFLRQYEFQVRRCACRLKRLYDDRMGGAAASIFLNGTYDFVLESGKDIIRDGFPFQEYMLFSGSIPTVADCLIALKHLVFEKKLYTVSQVKEAIRVNFEGYEVMRRQMLAAPKFGNDVDEVDLLAADIAGHFCTWLEEYRRESGFAVMPALYGWRFLDEAYGVAATPDGRRYADPIAEHYCATPGRAVCGPTAIIRSAAKAKKEIFRACGCTPFHLTLPRNLGKSEAESLEILSALNRAAIESGLCHMNIGIYDPQLLRRAQQDPENHKDVIVRVWGYSARFVDLCREMQEHVISRILQTP